MNESVVQVVQGATLTPEGKECVFCGQTKGMHLFSVSNGIKYNGVVLKHYPICTEHLDKLNALLSGEYEIDHIQLEQYRKQNNNLRFRG